MYKSLLGKALIVCASLIIALVGCEQQTDSSTTNTTPRTADTGDLVADLALARWQALIDGDIDQAYAYMSPSSRDIMSLERYKLRIRTGLWRDAAIDSTDCNEDACLVTIRVTIDVPGNQRVTTELTEKWVNDSGNWWYVVLI